KKLKIIHVAGTSGKGSTANNIYQILQKAGYKVGGHFSPFVSVSTEKIQINNRFISTDEFVNLVEKIKPIIEKCHSTFDTPSYFELWILLALKYFADKKCAYVVLEVGCGGRFDATNAVTKTLVSVITNIGLDHMHILGDTIPKIAFEKAGIIRNNGRVFTSAERPEALQVIQKEAKKKNANLTIIKTEKNENPNNLLAKAVCEYLKIPDKYIAAGFKSMPLAGRFEIMQTAPTIILDGAHNPDKIAFFTNKLLEFRKFNNSKKVHLICALTDHREAREIFSTLIPHVNKIYATRGLVAERKFQNPSELLKNLQTIKKIPGQSFLDPNIALKKALQNANKNDLIIITGSFFLVSELRQWWHDEIEQLEKRNNLI
ncbi:MAG: Mur ligase family protein, partial [Patescibacteria group bacterium]